MAKPDIAPRKEIIRQNERTRPLNREARLDKLSEMMQQTGVNAVLLSQPANIDYFTGFKGVEPADREAFVLFGKTDSQSVKRQDFVTRQLYFGQTPQGFTPMDILDLPTHLQSLKDQGVKTLGIEKDNLTVAEYELLQKVGIEMIGIEPKELRQYKTEQEIDRIREACRLGDITFEFMVGQIREGTSEIELRDILERHMRSQGITAPSFPTIVAFGENAANPHHMPDATKLTPNNFITFDFGFVGEDGYQSDMTRTIFYGQPTAEQIKMYATTLRAQKAVTKYLQETFTTNPHAQIVAKDIDNVARSIIEGEGYLPEHFPHGLGHGIGIETHEYPFINKRSDQKVTATMVFSNEPGIYIPGFQGVRIEDLLAVHTDGTVEVLMHSPKDLICIDPTTGKQNVISEEELFTQHTRRTA